MKRCLQIWRRISRLEDSAKGSSRETRCIQVCNQVVIIIASVMFMYPPVYVMQGLPKIAILTFFLGLSLVGTIVLNRFQRYPLLGRNYFLLVSNAIILSYCLLFGRDTWMHLFFLNAMTLPYIIFHPDNVWYTRLWGITPSILFFGLEFGGFQAFPYALPLTPKQQYSLYLWVSPSVFLIAFLYINHLYRTINQHETTLLHKIHDLQESYKLIEEQQIHLAAATHYSAIAELSASVAHEINNPLAIIKAYAEQTDILLKQSQIDQNRIKMIVQKIKNTVDRITKITMSLRLLSREGSEDALEVVDLHRLVEDVLLICREGLAREGIELRTELGSTPTIYRCRHVPIAQVLLNLIHNAKDAVADLNEKWIYIKLQAINEGIELSVTDSGRGISPEILPRIHKPFFTTKPPGKGTGLGLSISRKIVEAHRGQLIVDTLAPHTTFIVRLPQ